MKRPAYPRVFRASSDVSLELVGQWALAHKADRVLLVVAGHIDQHKGRIYARSCRLAAAVLGDGLLESFEADAWPITQMFGNTNTVFAGRFNADVLRRMVDADPNLASWVYPKPEDICFFRAGHPMPRFASVTHEKEAYYFSRTPPAFAAGAELEDGIGKSVPLGRYFCSVPKP